MEVERLHFDPDNPRFPKSVDGTDATSVLRFMLADANLIDLMRSIAAQGFFPGEPLLVSPEPGHDRNWRVIEGNRRLAATLLLREPARAPTRREAVRSVSSFMSFDLEALPCLQFRDRPSILRHLGYRHVTGIKEWHPLAKARYLLQRYDELLGAQADRYKELARTIGSRADYVGRLLTALAIYEAIEGEIYYAISGLTEETLDFSLLSSVLAYENIVRFLGIETAQSADLSGLRRGPLESLTRWVFERGPDGRTKLGESRNIRLLADVVASPRALEVLVAGAPLATAAKLAGAATESFRSALATATENVGLAHNYVDDLEEVTAADLATAQNLAATVDDLRRALEGRMDAGG